MMRLRFAGARAVAIVSVLAQRAARGLRKPLLIVVSGVIALLLLIVILQSGLGVDSDDTITDSQRPEIVGGE